MTQKLFNQYSCQALHGLHRYRAVMFSPTEAQSRPRQA